MEQWLSLYDLYLIPLKGGGKTMKARLTSLALVLALLGALLMLPGSAVAQTTVTNQVSEIPMTGTVQGGGTFTGLLDIRRFVVQNGELVALGSLSGELTNIVGGTREVRNMNVAIPVTSLQFDPPPGSCEILHLDLGPLHLRLLGLHVDLDEVILDITAVPSEGLLGQLLCAIAGLLNNGGPLQQIANLLNQILGILQGLGL
jgi:hypothetical protein